MPRIRLISPDGFNWEIDTRSPELLRQWFDEILPWSYIAGRPGIDDFEMLWPCVDIKPMWAWQLDAVRSLHRQAHPGQALDPKLCHEEPCRHLSTYQLTDR